MAVTISATNIGPIASGRVELHPLTVFIGPNNAGKSFMAMLAYAALHASSARTHFGGASFFVRNYSLSSRAPLRYPADIKDDVSAFLATVFDSNQASLRRATPGLQEYLKGVFDSEILAYAGGLVQELERCFGSKIRDITKFGKPRETIELAIENSSPRWSVSLSMERGRATPKVLISPRLGNVVVKFNPRLVERWRSAPDDLALTEIVGRLVYEIFSGFPRQSFYLPAARSGILQSHKALASFVVSRSSLAGIEEMDIPKMSGVIADFISALLTIDHTERTQLDGVARFLETDLLSGTIKMRGTKLQYPEILYESDAGKFPLHRTSSMISELAPVVLFLRYLVTSRAALIIEEPESHLHPQSQRKFARAVARLVNSGVHVLLTTHSDYFLNQINNAILLSLLPNDIREESGYSLDDCIKAREVAAHLFKVLPNAAGTAITGIRVIEGEGISEEEFGAVAEQLYSETVYFQRNVEVLND